VGLDPGDGIPQWPPETGSVRHLRDRAREGTQAGRGTRESCETTIMPR
jgi:hypothetical protein